MMIVVFYFLQLGCAPLHIASELGHTAIVEHLTDNGALLDLPVEVRIYMLFLNLAYNIVCVDANMYKWMT